MEFPVWKKWFPALLYLLTVGLDVLSDCTVEDVQIEGGTYKLTKRLQEGSRLIYSCPEGHYPHPEWMHLCQANGSWTPAARTFPPQRCKVVECPDPNVLLHGHVSPPQEKYFVGNETVYECNSGHTLRGSLRRVCLASGKWSGGTPICSRDTGHHCDDPGVPAGASRSGNSLEIGDRVRYHCNNNLSLIGSPERVCQEDGQWTGMESACYYKHTFDTAQEAGWAFGRQIVDRLVELQPDYEHTRKIKISKTGELNIYIAIDISENMKEYNGDTRAIIKTLIRKISRFAVTPNYEIVYFASDVQEVANIIDFRSRKEIQTILKKLELEGGCQTFNSASTLAQIKNLVYMHPEDDQNTHSREKYLDIYIFTGGIPSDGNLEDFTVGTGGKHYFKMRSYEHLEEAFDQNFDEDEARVLCGLHKPYNSHDRDSNRSMYPWAVTVIVLANKCAGSLVTPQFVLTAAHCFTSQVQHESVVVDVDGQLRRAKRVWIHPLYVRTRIALGASHFYDYDAALIQLMEDVVVSTAVRPICIPCTEETNDALRLNLTCTEQEQLLLNRHFEKLTFLTHIRQTMMPRHVLAKLHDRRDECISHVLNTHGITASDPKAVVTDNFLCTGGRNPLRDPIACLADGGAAVFKNHEHRTIQVALVSWGTKLMCLGGVLVESDADSRDFHLNLFRVVPFLKSILGNDTQDDYQPLKFVD